MDDFRREIKAIIEKSDISRVRNEAESCLYLIGVEKYRAAVDRIREVLKNTASPALFNFLLAVAYYSMGEIGAARKAVDKAIELDPRQPFFAGWKAMILLAGSNVKEARDWADRVLQQSPNEGFSHYVSGKVLMMQKKWEDAELHLRQAFADLHNVEPVGVLLAQALLKQKKSEEARDLLASLSREEPANEQVQGLLFLAEENLDHFDEAIRLGERVLETNPRPIINCILKKLRFKKQLTEELAAESFEPCGKDALLTMLNEYFSPGLDFILSRISREELDSLSFKLTADRMLSLLVHVNRLSDMDYQTRHAWPQANGNNSDRVVLDKTAWLGYCSDSCACVARYRKASSQAAEAFTHFVNGDLDQGLGHLLRALLADYGCRRIYHLFRAWIHNLEPDDCEMYIHRENIPGCGESLDGLLKQTFRSLDFLKTASAFMGTESKRPAIGFEVALPFIVAAVELARLELEEMDIETRDGSFRITMSGKGRHDDSQLNFDFSLSYEKILEMVRKYPGYKQNLGLFFLVAEGPPETFGSLRSEMKSTVNRDWTVIEEKWSIIESYRREKQEKLKRILSQLQMLPLQPE